jgi:hypothetical protein
MYKERERIKGDIHDDGYDRDMVSQCEITMTCVKLTKILHSPVYTTLMYQY